MNRKTFFKRLFGVTAAAVVAPRILAEEKEETFQDIVEVDMAGVPDGMKVQEVVQIYNQTGCFLVTGPGQWEGITTRNHLGAYAVQRGDMLLSEYLNMFK